jgi:hypothetical protein
MKDVNISVVQYRLKDLPSINYRMRRLLSDFMLNNDTHMKQTFNCDTDILQYRRI